MKLGVALALAAAMSVMSSAGGMAQDDKLALIKARQDFMEAQQKDFDAISAYAKGTGDKDTAQAKLDDLIAHAVKVMDNFPPGTSAKEFPGKTKAKPELWEEMDKVKQIAAALKPAEEKLVEVIKTGTPDQLRAAAGSLYHNNCTGCHTPYRLPES